MHRKMMLLMGFVLAGAALAASGNTLQSSEQVTIDAPAAKVWKAVKDFNALDRWHPAVASEKLVKGRNNEPGAERLLTLGNGGTIHEQLKAWNGSQMSYTYVILKSVLPVRDYSSTISVQRLSDHSSRLTWSGEYKAAHGTGDAKAQKTIDSVYTAGIDHVKQMVEQE